MADSSREKGGRPRITAKSQYETDAELLREKTARLRAQRLAHQAANAAPGTAEVASGPKSIRGPKKERGKERKKGLSLSEWQEKEQNEGRRG
jgi:hypothetical protein